MKKKFATKGANTIVVEASNKTEAVKKLQVYAPETKLKDVQRFN